MAQNPVGLWCRLRKPPTFTHTHQQDIAMQSHPPLKKTPFLNLIAFMLAFGWEGPVIFSIGWGHGSTLEMMIGLVFTAFFWGMFGIKLLLDLIKHVFKWKSPAAALVPKAPAGSDQ
jgi:hypothetical protein